MNEAQQQQQSAAMSEQEFIVALSMFRPDERAVLLAKMVAAVKGNANR
jgi:hypothetical protein